MVTFVHNSVFSLIRSEAFFFKLGFCVVYIQVKLGVQRIVRMEKKPMCDY